LNNTFPTGRHLEQERQPQGQTQNKNHLSKGTKIAIAVGVIAAVVAITVGAKADKGPTDALPVFKR